jgi:O-methyltransferase
LQLVVARERALVAFAGPEFMTQMTIGQDYLSLLKSALCASLYDESAWWILEGPTRQRLRNSSWLARVSAEVKLAILRALKKRKLVLVRQLAFNPSARDTGADWPLFGYTMTGRKRLDALQSCIETVLKDNVPGDFIETGVWRGGSVIFMRAVLKANAVSDRIIWCADSFSGMPIANDKDIIIDPNSDLSDQAYLNVSLEQVQGNFARFGLLDQQVRFLKGWFRDTLPSAPISRLAILRLDGDLYESTMDALASLYDKLSHGGFIIVDDYNTWKGCKEAIDEFRTSRSIKSPILSIDHSAIMWRK